MSTFIHGCASVQSIDTASEIVDIRGLDITSLARSGILNFEHDQGKDAEGKLITIKLPAQIVGKILKAKKLFSSSDCTTPSETYFWNKTKIPFVYILAELLDDYCDSARECAGKFKYSKDRPDLQAILGFSVEGSELPGSRVNKILIGRSIARKVTLTSTPANHMCIAEIYDEAMDSAVKDEFESLFRSEQEAVTLFKSDEGSRLYDQFLLKKEIDFKHTPKFGPISSVAKMPGIPIGQTKSGKDVMSHLKPNDYKGWSTQDHRDAGNIHYSNAEAGKGVPGATHFDSAKRHLAFANKSEPMAKGEDLKKDANMAAPPAEPNAANAQSMQNGGTSGGTSFSQAMSNLSSGLGLSKKDKSKQKPLQKAVEAGSYNAAPSSLVNGAAYQVEGLSSKQAKTGAEDHNFQGTKKKTDWNKRSKDEYERWPQREAFEKFMSARMPHLALGEIKAVGRALALSKSLDLERSLILLVDKKRK
jgi:hypothetical protein